MTELESVVSSYKRALLATKEKLLNDIKFCEKRLEEVRLNASQAYVFEDEEDSSDSDAGIPLPIHSGPTTTELKLRESNLSVCLHATQELTSLQVIESEVNVLVDPPVLDKKSESSVEGTWREVTAECRIDLVPFSITFFVHQPNRKFAAPSYHNVRVTVVKAMHDIELAQSVLSEVRTPSDAVEVIGSYALAHRSRRTTLARLADKFPNTLFMETMSTGGYVLKCADVLRVSWKVQNKWSHIAPFHHQMKFELECIEEQYLKEIKRAHSQLIDPTLQTDERTALLAKIIELCLEATSAPTESDTDTDGRAARTTLESEPEISPERKRSGEKLPEVGVKRSRTKDCEVMAPPKQLPKKGKPKGKINAVGPKGKERAVDDVRKGKVSSGVGRNNKQSAASGQKKDNVQRDSAANGQNAKDKSEKVNEKDVNEPNVKEKVVSGQKVKEKAGAVQRNKENVQKANNTENGLKDKQSATNVQKSKETVPKDEENNGIGQKVDKQNKKQIENAKKAVKIPLDSYDRKNADETNVKTKGSSENVNKEVNTKSETENVKKTAKRPLQNDDKINVNVKEHTATTNTDVVSKKTKITKATTQSNTNKVKKTLKVADNHADDKNEEANQKSKHSNITEKLADVNLKDSNNKEQIEKSNKASIKNKTGTTKAETAKEIVRAEKIISGNTVQSKPTQNKTKTVQDTNENDKNVQNKPTKTQMFADKTKTAENLEKPTKSSKISAPMMPVKSTKIPMKILRNSPAKLCFPRKNPPPSGKKVPTENKMLSQNIEKRGSKIPKHKLAAISEGHLRRFQNPLRISPRKTPSAVTAGLTVGSSKQMEAVRNSPRLLKKPTAKPKSMFVF